MVYFYLVPTAAIVLSSLTRLLIFTSRGLSPASSQLLSSSITSCCSSKLSLIFIIVTLKASSKLNHLIKILIIVKYKFLDFLK
jgi:hypothetical protein